MKKNSALMLKDVVNTITTEFRVGTGVWWICGTDRK